MNKHDEIKKLLKASQNMLSSRNSINETNEIRQKYNLILEQVTSDEPRRNRNIDNSIDFDISQTYDDETKLSDRDEQTAIYRISGGILKISGKSEKEIQLTEDEKQNFQETMDEFIDEVTNLVEFGNIHIYKNDVTWFGRLKEFDLEFRYRVGEENGVYVKVNNLSKLSDDILKVMGKLKKYYNKFKSKWGDVLGNRKMTKIDEKL